MTSDRGPLVSVIIPCHGHARFLAAAIDSVLDQGPVVLEVIVVDDGSLDDTAAVASSYAEVELVRQERTGLPGARNAGLAIAEGEFVVFLDADDRLVPGGIGAGLDALATSPDVAFVAGAHRRVDSQGKPLSGPVAAPLGDDDPYVALLRGNWIGMHAAVLYRRDVVVDVGGFDEDLPACEDYDLYLRIARSRPVHQHDTIVAEYRRHGENMSDNVSLMLREVLVVLGRQLDHVVGDPIREEALREGLQNWAAYYLTAGNDADGWSSSTPRHRVAATVERRIRRLGRAIRRRARFWRAGVPPPGAVDLGDLGRRTPISVEFGYDRGSPVDRHFIEEFLAVHAEDVRGRVLEIGDDSYTRRFGGGRVRSAATLHVDENSPDVDYVGTLEDGAGLPDETFDCVILTQTLHLIYDLAAAFATVHRVLAPGGVLLATVPGISQISTDQWSSTWSWAITPYAMRRLLEDHLPGAAIDVSAHGNVLTSVAFLEGLASEELADEAFELHDPAYPMLVTARAVKAAR